MRSGSDFAKINETAEIAFNIVTVVLTSRQSRINMDFSKMAVFFPELATYNLKMDKYYVKATIVENDNQLANGLQELRNAVNCFHPVLGFDLKTRTVQPNNTKTQHILFLYALNRCLVILINPLVILSSNLQSFLSNTSFCFVGKNVSEKVKILTALATAVDVIVLAARFVKKRELLSCSCLVQVGKSIGLDFMESNDEQGSGKDHPDWTNLCLSEKDMMIEISEADMCYKIADFCRKKLAAGSSISS